MPPRSKPRKRAPGAGRPPKLPADRLSATVKVPLTPERHAQVVAAAEAVGQSAADWGREAFDLALARGSTR